MLPRYLFLGGISADASRKQIVGARLMASDPSTGVTRVRKGFGHFSRQSCQLRWIVVFAMGTSQ